MGKAHSRGREERPQPGDMAPPRPCTTREKLKKGNQNTPLSVSHSRLDDIFSKDLP